MAQEEKDYIWNAATCSCENAKYLTIIVDNSMIICNEIIDAIETKIVPTILSEITIYKLLWSYW